MLEWRFNGERVSFPGGDMAGPAVLPEIDFDTDTDTQSRRQPPYAVILHNDDITSMDWVILVLQKVFGYPVEKCHYHMLEAHETDRSIVWGRYAGSRGVKSRSNDFVRAGPEHEKERRRAAAGDRRSDGLIFPQSVHRGHFQNLARCQPAQLLFPFGFEFQRCQAFGATQIIRFQFPGRAVAPIGGDFEQRGCGAIAAAAEDGVRGHAVHGRSPADRVRQLIAFDFGEGVERRFGFGLFFIPAPNRLVAMPGDLRGDLEALIVLGPLFIEDHIPRCGAEFGAARPVAIGTSNCCRALRGPRVRSRDRRISK